MNLFDRLSPYNMLPNLPPAGIDLASPQILRKLASASRQLGELNGLCVSLPDPYLLVNTIVLQESKDSSAIENIVTTQDELYLAATETEAGSPEAKEVLQYRQALYTGLGKMCAENGLIRTNTIVQMVQTIKQNQAGIRNIPGTVLKNAITGETIYTPPCCEDVLREKLAALEAYIHLDQPDDPDPLIKMCLIHYQFEAIHPFADGNGRTGRMLNTLYLVQQGLLTEPVLFLSGYILQHKNTYYSLLNAVTEEGQWQDWIMYMLTAIEETSKRTAGLIRDIIALKNHIEKELQRVLGASYDHELLQLLFKQPYLKIELIEKAGIAHRQTASTWLKKMTTAGLVRPLKRGRTTYYINHRLMELLKD